MARTIDTFKANQKTHLFRLTYRTAWAYLSYVCFVGFIVINDPVDPESCLTPGILILILILILFLKS